MEIYDIIGGILLLLSGIFVTLLVMVQQHDQNGMSALTGANTSAERSRTRTKDMVLARWTKVFGIVLVVLAFVVNILNVFFSK